MPSQSPSPRVFDWIQIGLDKPFYDRFLDQGTRFRPFRFPRPRSAPLQLSAKQTNTSCVRSCFVIGIWLACLLFFGWFKQLLHQRAKVFAESTLLSDVNNFVRTWRRHEEKKFASCFHDKARSNREKLRKVMVSGPNVKENVSDWTC